MNSNKIILLLIGIVTCTLVVKKLTPIYTILLISLSIIGYSLSNDIISAISIASISVYIILYLNDSNYMETFKINKIPIKKKILLNQINKDTKKIIKIPINKKIYKKLPLNQIKSLNNDTKELIKTQKYLINTLNNIKPILKKSNYIFGSFKKKLENI